MKRITEQEELVKLADELGMRPDWHEPDEQNVTAEFYGMSFDNAGFWADGQSDGKRYEEMYVELRKDGKPVAAVNLATLFAWATNVSRETLGKD